MLDMKGRKFTGFNLVVKRGGKKLTFKPESVDEFFEKREYKQQLIDALVTYFLEEGETSTKQVFDEISFSLFFEEGEDGVEIDGSWSWDKLNKRVHSINHLESSLVAVEDLFDPDKNPDYVEKSLDLAHWLHVYNYTDFDQYKELSDPSALLGNIACDHEEKFREMWLDHKEPSLAEMIKDMRKAMCGQHGDVDIISEFLYYADSRDQDLDIKTKEGKVLIHKDSTYA